MFVLDQLRHLVEGVRARLFAGLVGSHSGAVATSMGSPSANNFCLASSSSGAFLPGCRRGIGQSYFVPGRSLLRAFWSASSPG